jgi:GDP-4-dehydro-6-deoxy-D-mannose reductase
MVETNVGSTASILDSIRSLAHPCRLLLAGSAAEYGRPANASPLREDAECRPELPYGMTKFAATTIALAHARAWDTPVVVFRPFNALGSGAPPYLLTGALIDRIYAAVRSGERFVVVGRVDTERDFLAVQDVVESVVRLLESDATGEIFNVCSGVPTRVEDVVKTLIKLAAPGLEYRVNPSLVRRDDVVRAYGDPTKLVERVGKRPSVSIESALAEAWRARVGRGDRCES